MAARRDAQLLSVAWRAWHFSAQLHHLVDHYCGIAAREERSQGIKSAFSLVLCPCAMRAVHKGEPVECSCGGATPERAQQAAAGPQGRDDVLTVGGGSGMMAQCQTCASRVETCRARTGAQLSSC